MAWDGCHLPFAWASWQKGKQRMGQEQDKGNPLPCPTIRPFSVMFKITHPHETYKLYPMRCDLHRAHNTLKMFGGKFMQIKLSRIKLIYFTSMASHIYVTNAILPIACM